MLTEFLGELASYANIVPSGETLTIIPMQDMGLFPCLPARHTLPSLPRNGTSKTTGKTCPAVMHRVKTSEDFFRFGGES